MKPIRRKDLADVLTWIEACPKTTTFAEAVTEFREAYGPGFRGKLHTAFEWAWKVRRKEVRKVADVPETPTYSRADRAALMEVLARGGEEQEMFLIADECQPLPAPPRLNIGDLVPVGEDHHECPGC